MCSFILTAVTAVTLLAVSVEAWANRADNCTYFDKFDIVSAFNTELNINIPNTHEYINQCLCINGISSKRSLAYGL